MNTARRPNRRSFVTRVAGGMVLTGGGRTPYVRFPPTQTPHCTDSDRGNNADLPQRGVRC